MSTDRRLRRDSARFTRLGLRFLLAALALAVVGVVLLLAGSGGDLANGLGQMITWLAGVPAAVGVALLLIGGTAGWAGRRKPFA